MNINQILIIVCGVLFIGAVTNFALSGVEPVALGAPKMTSDPVVVLTAALPPIGDFKSEFYINDFNPFVPGEERKIEVAAINKPIVVATKRLPQTKPPVNPVELGPLQFPPRAANQDNTPQVKMIIAHENGDKQLAMLLGGKEHLIKEGDTVDQWKLLELSHGSARFADPTGGERLFIIATGSNVGAPPSAPPQPGPGTKPIKPGKPQANLPMPPGVGGKKLPTKQPRPNGGSTATPDPNNPVPRPQRVWPSPDGTQPKRAWPSPTNVPPRPSDPAEMQPVPEAPPK
jgi:hypothetical protein